MPSRHLLALLFAAAALSALAGAAAQSGASDDASSPVPALDNWRPGRATFYGAPGDIWSIHDGSCTHQYIWPDIGTGWDVGAMDDQSPEFVGSCGRCYEIKCNPVDFTDGYGASLDRSSVCYDPDASVIITIVDACPCNYAANYYSNKRWCCGDMDHFDISVWAFERLASTKWGVIALKYRPVSCNYKPAKPAPQIANPTPGIPPPQGAKHP